MKSVRFEYQLSGTGWADAAIFVDEEKFPMAVSYLHDSLRQLLEQVAAFLAGRSEEARVIFMDEPGEHWLIVRRQKEGAEFELRWYDDWASWKMFSEERYSTQVLCTVCLEEFTASILEVVQKILRDESGTEGYKKKWCEHEFPSEAFEALRKLSNA